MAVKRDPFFDNAKLLLILFVVFGHLLNDFRESSPILYSIYNFIYFFHIPGFVFIAGYFSKNYGRSGHFGNLVVRMLLPYLFFHIAYHILYHFLEGDPVFPLRIYDPHWTLWFLVSMVSWYALLRPLKKLPYPFLISLIAGLGVGCIGSAGCELSLSRTFVFLPFFVLGHLTAEKKIDFLRTKKAGWVGLFGLMTLFMGVHFLIPNGVEDWLLGSYSYSAMEMGRIQGVALRVGVYSVSFLVTACFLAVVPKRNLFFTEFGSRSLYVFLLHGFFVQTVLAVPSLHSWVDGGHYWFIFTLSLVLTVLLASRPVVWFAKPVVELERGGGFPLESVMPHKLWAKWRKERESGGRGETRQHYV